MPVWDVRDAAAGGQEVQGQPAPDAEGQEEDFCEIVDPVTEQEEQVGEAAGGRRRRSSRAGEEQRLGRRSYAWTCRGRRDQLLTGKEATPTSTMFPCC